MGSDDFDLCFKTLFSCGFLIGCIMAFCISLLIYIWFVQ